MQLPKRLSEQLEGREGPTRQKAARLVVDLARVAKAESFVEVDPRTFLAFLSLQEAMGCVPSSRI